MSALVAAKPSDLPRQGAREAPTLACAQRSTNSPVFPPRLRRSLLPLLGKGLPGGYSPLVLSPKTLDNGCQRPRVGC
jgi:hypothetical protein